MANMLAERTIDDAPSPKALLEYHRARGVDCALEATPRDRFKDSARRVVKAPAVVEAPPPALAPSLGPDQTSEGRPAT